MPITIALINECPDVFPDADVALLAAALQLQGRRDLALHYPQFAGCTVVPVTNADVNNGWTPAPGVWLEGLLRDADQADALGYHDVTAAGLPLGKVFVATTLNDNGIVSVTASHEFAEMGADPNVDQTANVVTPQGIVVCAFEIGDAPEDDQFASVINGIHVSDFVLPAWFDTSAAGPFDFGGHVQQAFQLLPGGYIGIQVNGQWTQLTADRAIHKSARARYRGNRWHKRVQGSGRGLMVRSTRFSAPGA